MAGLWQRPRRQGQFRRLFQTSSSSGGSQARYSWARRKAVGCSSNCHGKGRLRAITAAFTTTKTSNYRHRRHEVGAGSGSLKAHRRRRLGPQKAYLTKKALYVKMETVKIKSWRTTLAASALQPSLLRLL